MTLRGVRIAEPAAKDAIGDLFRISITSAVAGIAIKVQRQRRLAFDDESVIVITLLDDRLAYISNRAAQCPNNAVGATKRLKFSVGILGFDILTVMMIMAIPICVLGQLKPQRYQKLGLSIFACLNFRMIIGL
ncbi:hypothetical protein MMC22_003446 [Lobaria immixta]|nr:hypothetical protein [Lobaria immixta]